MVLDPFTLTDVEAERPDDRPEDREDETDRAIKTARTYCVQSVDLLVMMMRAGDVSNDLRIKAAIALLEVAGCL